MSSRSKRSSRIPHARRPEARGAVHVVLSVRRGLPGMRTPRAWRVLERAFRRGKERNGMRLLQFSVQEDHIHMVVEVLDKTGLSRGMQGLGIRLAKALNKHWHRAGKVFADRFFSRVAKTMAGVRTMTRYVLQNAFKHGAKIPKRYEGQPDPYSSGRWYLFWIERDEVRRPHRSPPVVRTLFTKAEFSGWIGLNEKAGDRATIYG